MHDLAGIAHACRQRHIACLVLDVEPIVVRWEGGADVFAQQAEAARRSLFADVPSLRVLALVTNSARPAPPLGDDTVYVRRAWKPWRLTWAARLPTPTAIAGDVVLTDGVVACRVGATFMHYAGAVDTPGWTRVQAALGRTLEPWLFTKRTGS